MSFGKTEPHRMPEEWNTSLKRWLCLSCHEHNSVVDMSEEVSVEELQKQILEMKEANEKTAVEMQNLKESLSKSEDSLKAARELNAKLMSKVPGEDGTAPEEKDPYEGMSDMEVLEKMSEEMVDKIIAAQDAKKNKS